MATLHELEASTAVDATGMGSQSYGAQALYTIGHDFPGVMATTGRSVFATRQTILRGGFRDSAGKMVGRRHRFLDPRTLFRHPKTSIALGEGPYNPFQASHYLNQVFNWGAKGQGGAKRLAKNWGLSAEDILPIGGAEGKYVRGVGYVPRAGKAIEPTTQWTEAGLLGKMSAASKMNQMQSAGRLFGKGGIDLERMENIIHQRNSGIYSVLTGQSRAGEAGARLYHGEAFGLTSKSIAGRFMTGAQMAERTIDVGMTKSGLPILDKTTKSAFDSSVGKAARRGWDFIAKNEKELIKYGGSEKGFGRIITATKGIYRETAAKNAAKLAAGEVVEKTAAREAAGFAAKTAGRFGTKAAGWLLPGLDVVMAAWMVWDLTKMGIDLAKLSAKAVVDTASAGFKSFKGSIDKPLLNSGTYVDTEIAATSRARGVMAIQNSRLNARSALGNEAAGMHAHFG